MLAHSFLDQLPNCTHLSQCLSPTSSQPLPDDWSVIVTDIVNSSQAIEQGKYKEVNTVGICSIVAVLNSLHKEIIPYVFGGDGASFCIPPEYQAQASEALRGCQQFAWQSFSLQLRVGIIPYREVKSLAPIRVAKLVKSESLLQAIFTGGGLAQADALIKQDSAYLIEPNQAHHKADFSGFECRWNEIPSTKDYTISLMVQFNPHKFNAQESLQRLQTLLLAIDQITGNEQNHHPVTASNLSLTLNPLKLLAEAKSKTFSSATSLAKVISQLLLQALIGKFLMTFSIQTGEAKWGEYKTDFIKNSDYKKVDDALRMTLSVSHAELNELEALLSSEYHANHLFYGIHKTHAALVTCMIEKTGVKHMHFIDANNGGYTLAAKMLKQQIKSFTTS